MNLVAEIYTAMGRDGDDSLRFGFGRIGVIRDPSRLDRVESLSQNKLMPN
jgi:hypothetical protein